MMTNVLTAAVVLGTLSSVSPVLAADSADTLRGLNAEYDKALVTGDVGALNRIYSEDFTYTNPDGVLRSKAEQLAFVKAGKLGLTSGHSDEVRVRIYGHFAIITGRFKWGHSQRIRDDGVSRTLYHRVVAPQWPVGTGGGAGQYHQVARSGRPQSSDPSVIRKYSFS